MENASKALIIAGAILLAILIISLGILVYNQASDTVDEANLDTEEIETFNAKFLDYVGTGQSSATIDSLVSLINSSNAAESNSARGLYITLTTKSGVTSSSYSAPSQSVTTRPTTKPSAYSYTTTSTYTYNISAFYGTDGAIIEIVVTPITG